ncbi:MAG: cyclic-di-AMP receptor [Anaerolineales bacterium]|nr:cyclic-di-AMP receptor [Anaerolineales bacterium]
MNAPRPVHYLLVAVVQDQDLDAATRALKEIGAPVTYLSSAGGFLGRRNMTLLIGLPQEKELEALVALQETCKRRIEYMTLPLEGALTPMPAPVPVTVGGAIVFALPVDRFEQF